MQIACVHIARIVSYRAERLLHVERALKSRHVYKARFWGIIGLFSIKTRPLDEWVVLLYDRLHIT